MFDAFTQHFQAGVPNLTKSTICLSNFALLNLELNRRLHAYSNRCHGAKRFLSRLHKSIL